MKRAIAILIALVALSGCTSFFRTGNPIGAAVLGLPELPETEEVGKWYTCGGEAVLRLDTETNTLSCSDGKEPVEIPPPGEWERNTAEVLATRARH